MRTRLAALLALLPALARAQATVGDFQTPPLKQTGGTIAEQHPAMIRALQALGAVYQAKVTSGTEPADVLQCVMFGLQGQSTTRKDWRACATSDDAYVFEQNTSNDAAPTWVERLRITSAGITTAPAPHTHPASDVVSGQFADNRVSQSSVEQYAVSTPAASRIPKSDVSALLAPGWIPQTGVTQYQGAINAGVAIAASQVTSGTFADARIAKSSITQYGFLIPTGGAFLWMTSTTCPTGSTEVTAFRNRTLRGADVAVADSNIPNSPNIACPGGTGCGAAASAYDDVPDQGEMFAHFHTQPTHVHSGPSHTHTQPTHTHTLSSHTHDVVLGAHTHNLNANHANSPDGSGPRFPGDSDTTNPLTLVTASTDLGTKTSGGPSTNVTGSGGGDTTGASGTGNTSAGGGDNTSTEGSSLPHLHAFVTVLVCQVN